MSKDKIDFNKRFLDIFTTKELNDIINNATVVIENCIMINTKNNFFELSFDSKDKLDIFCYNSKNSTESKLTKDEFFKLYKSSPFEELQYINVDN